MPRYAKVPSGRRSSTMPGPAGITVISISAPAGKPAASARTTGSTLLIALRPQPTIRIITAT